MLGVKLDLRDARLGAIAISNTPERVDELVCDIDSIVKAETLSRKDGERLRGRLQFANTQLFGRSMRRDLRDLSMHVDSGRKALTKSTLHALQQLKSKLMLNRPRLVSKGLSSHVHLYVDASYEPEGFSGLGGLCVDSSGKVMGFFSEAVPKELLQLIKHGDKETAIQELEMVAITIAVEVWRECLGKHRVVIFSANDSVRKSIIKGYSSNPFVNTLLGHLFVLEDAMNCQLWLERVPSQSNPADAPSREECTEIPQCKVRIRVDVMGIWVTAAQVAGGDSAAKA